MKPFVESSLKHNGLASGINLLLLIVYLADSVSTTSCPSNQPSSPIPGCWGQPACAYYIAADQGLPECTPDYCFCDGTTVPLLAPTGTLTSSNCDYPTQPASNVDLGTVKGCIPDKTSIPAGATTNIGTTSGVTTKTSIPIGATIVTENISDNSMVVTYAPTKATKDVTTTTTDKQGHTGVIVIPKGQWIWGLFGPPPAGGPPPLPAPPGGVAPPADPDTGKPDDPEDPNSSKDPHESTTMTTSKSVSTTASSSKSSSVASCVPADVAIASDYPFAIGNDGEELASVTISEDIIYDSMTSASPSTAGPPSTTSSKSASSDSTLTSPTAPSSGATQSPSPVAKNFECNTGPPFKRIDPGKAKTKIQKLCGRYHKDKMVLSENGQHLPDSKYAGDEDMKGVAEDGAETEVNPNFAAAACDPGKTSTDFGAMSADDCTANFMFVLDNCSAASANGDYTSLGGQLRTDCSFWTITAE